MVYSRLCGKVSGLFLFLVVGVGMCKSDCVHDMLRLGIAGRNTVTCIPYILRMRRCVLSAWTCRIWLGVRGSMPTAYTFGKDHVRVVGLDLRCVLNGSLVCVEWGALAWIQSHMGDLLYVSLHM